MSNDVDNDVDDLGYYDAEDALSEGEDTSKKRTRGQNKSIPTSRVVPLTKQKWASDHELYCQNDVGNGVEQSWVGKKSAISLYEGRIVCLSCTQNNGGTLTYVPQDRHDHLAQHFGFGTCAPAKKHAEGLPAFWTQPRLEFNAPKGQSDMEKVSELMTDLAMATAAGGASVPQMGHFVHLLKKWLNPAIVTHLPNDPYAIMQKGLPLAAAAVEREASDERRGYQHHLSGDAATDNRGRSVYLTTTEFGGGKSQLVDIAFPVSSLDAKVVGEINSRVIAAMGGNAKVDTYHHDSAAYMVKWGKTLDSTYTLDCGDVVHRLDGAMDRMFESSTELKLVVSCLNNLLCSSHRGFVQGFSNFVQTKYEFRKYPSPGETRAWTGTYRVLEWCFLYLDLLVEYVGDTFPRTPDPSEKFKEFYEFACDEQRRLEFRLLLVWYLQYCADFVVWIMQLQSRIVPCAQSIFGAILSMLDFTVHSKDTLRSKEFFQSRILLGDKGLQAAYSTVINKKKVKEVMVTAVDAAGVQLAKNFGVFTRKIGVDSWTVEFTCEGDAIGSKQIIFYAICSALDMRDRTLQIPPAREMFDQIPWDITPASLDGIHQQLSALLKDAAIALPLDGDLRGFYRSLEMSKRSAYGKVARFALRCLDVPGGSAEVERAVSAYNRIVTTDRTRLSDENIRNYVMIFANGNAERKRHNEQRSADSLVAQKKKKDDREFNIEDVFKPTKKARAAADDDDE